MSTYGTTYFRHTRHKESIPVSYSILNSAPSPTHTHNQTYPTPHTHSHTHPHIHCATFYFILVEELQRFMEISKLQTPRIRRKKLLQGTRDCEARGRWNRVHHKGGNKAKECREREFWAREKEKAHLDLCGGKWGL